MIKRNERIIEVLKDKYEYENNRRDYYDNAIALPVTLLGFIVAGCYFILSEKTGIKFIDASMPYLIMPLVASMFFGMFFLFRVFFGFKRKYGSFPKSSDVLQDYENIKNYYKNLPETNNTQEEIDQDLDDFIIKWYTDSNEVSTKSNDVRMNAFHNSKLSIIVCYIFGIMIFSLYCYSKLYPVHMSNQNTNKQSQNSNNSQPTKPADQPPPKPQPKPIRMEKGQKGGKLS